MSNYVSKIKIWVKKNRLVIYKKYVIRHYMKHLIFAFFLIILGLGQPEAYAQDNTEPTETPLPVITEQNERPAEESHKEEQTDIDQANQDGSSPVRNMEGKEIPALSRSDQISKNANTIAIVQAFFSFFTLLLAGLATWFAYGAWRSGRRGVDVADETAKRQLRAYLSIKNKTGPTTAQLKERFYAVFSITNFGQTPARNATVDVQSFIADFPLPDGFTLPENWKTAGGGANIHHSDTLEAPIARDALSNDEINSIIGNDASKRIYGVVRVIYSDIFTTRYVEQACVSFTFYEPNKPPYVSPTQEHNVSE